MASCHAEIYHKDGRISKVAYYNGASLELIKQDCLRQAQQIFNQEMRMSQEPFKPTQIQIVVDKY